MSTKTISSLHRFWAMSLLVILMFLCPWSKLILKVKPANSPYQYSASNEDSYLATYLKNAATSTYADDRRVQGGMDVNRHVIIQPLSNECDLDPDHWTTRNLPAHLANLDQEDPRLAHHIRDCWILRPTGRPRNLTDPKGMDYSQRGQGTFLDAYFHKTINRRNGGFYIECGAFDGERLSNTLALETRRDWKGLLIEADPRRFKEIIAKNRNAYLLNACLSTDVKPVQMNYSVTGSGGGLVDYHKRGTKELNPKKQMMLQCLPLYTVLVALGELGHNRVDVFSLDVEGAETAILNTLPMNKTNVMTFLVETTMGNDHNSTKRKQKYVTAILNKSGYSPVEVPFYIDTFFAKRTSGKYAK